MDNKQEKDIFKDGFSFDLTDDSDDAIINDESITEHMPLTDIKQDSIIQNPSDDRMEHTKQETNTPIMDNKLKEDETEQNFLSSVNQNAKEGFAEEQFSYQKNESL